MPRQELAQDGLAIKRQAPLPLVYNGVRLRCGYRAEARHSGNQVGRAHHPIEHFPDDDSSTPERLPHRLADELQQRHPEGRIASVCAVRSVSDWCMPGIPSPPRDGYAARDSDSLPTGRAERNAMKITKIQTDILRIPEDDPLADMPEESGRLRPIVILRIQTDAGIEGIGLTFYGGAMTGTLRTAVDELGGL